jgi:hypothetical protein
MNFTVSRGTTTRISGRQITSTMMKEIAIITVGAFRRSIAPQWNDSNCHQKANMSIHRHNRQSDAAVAHGFIMRHPLQIYPMMTIRLMNKLKLLLCRLRATSTNEIYFPALLENDGEKGNFCYKQ